MTDEGVAAMVQGAIAMLEQKRDTPWDRDVRRFTAEMIRQGNAYEGIAEKAVSMADAIERSRKCPSPEAH